MRRVLGVVLLLVGAALLVVSAALLFAAHMRPLPYTIVGVLLSGAVFALAVFAWRRAVHMLNVGRLASVGAVAAAVVVVVCAVVAPAILSSRQRTPQLRTMSDLRNIAAALEARATSVNAYPTVAAFHQLEPYLTPTYIRALPQRDHWGHPLRYEWRGPAAAPNGYAIASAGRDGLWQRPHLRDYTRAATTNYDDDIVFADGEFVQFPDPGSHPE